MALDLLQSTNLSFLTVPLAFGLCYLPHLYAVHLLGLPNYDISNPRSFRETMARNTAISKTSFVKLVMIWLQRKEQVSRAEAASLNGLETIGVYAAAVLAGHHARVAPRALNRLALVYLLSRVAYTLFYVLVQNKRLHWLRTAIWLVGFATISTIWIRAGLAMAD